LQVKTTQPRRYLVRPNQGLLPPKGTEQISILLVDKDKQALLQSYERLGQSGLDHSKDKFLVQSCAVGANFAAKATVDSTELYDALTSMWNSVTAGGSSTQVYNKKLNVRHTVQESSGPKSVPAASVPPAKLDHTPASNMDKMSQEQLVTELSNLRRKYDELVSFSVNLTAERDILSNTLEQTKRDYNREMAARSALENKVGGSGSSGGSKAGRSMTGLLLQLLVVGLACFLSGVKMGSSGAASTLPIASMFVETPPTIVADAVVDVPPIEATKEIVEEE
jgi:MSP (Major sperm protein) domain